MGESITLLLLGAALAASGHAAMAGEAGGVRACNGDCALDRFADSVTAVAGYACRSGGGTVPALLRFSRLISWILALLLSGIALTCLQLEDVDSLWRTDYGCILSAKLILVALLLIVGAINRYALTGRI